MTISSQVSVLLVENDAHDLELVKYILSKAGFNVLPARDGLEGLALLQRNSVDLIVCAIKLPRIDGFAFRDRVLQDPGTRNLPFVFLTDGNEAADYVRGMKAGAEEFILKPFEPLILAARVQAVLERRKAYAEILRNDGLTRILNRVSIEKEIARELDRQKRFKGIGSLVFIDLDDFKGINDRYGHIKGDFILIRFAEILKQNTRSIDILGRYGGEEFVVYLPETAADGALIMCRRIFEFYAQTRLNDQLIGASFSAGVAESPRHGDDFYTLCDRADQAMYRAKKAGKARTFIWQEDAGNRPS
jgi:diguanylate cyclase (GGDEF)-like protein